MADKLIVPFRGRGKVNSTQTTLYDSFGKALSLATTLLELSIPTGKTIDVEDTSGLKIAGTAMASTAAELNALNGVTAGTVTASKALVCGASKELATLTTATITTATIANMAGNVTFADGATDVDIASHDATNGLKLGGTLVTADAGELNESDMTGSVGTVGGTNITVAETGNKAMHKSVFTLAAHPLTVTDAGANGGHGTTVMYTFPEGHIRIISSHANLTVFSAQGSAKADSGVIDVGVGTTATATDNEALATTEQDIVNKLEDTLDGSGDLSATKNGTLATSVNFDGSASATTLNFNAAITAATISATEVFDVTAVVSVYWINLGDD